MSRMSRMSRENGKQLVGLAEGWVRLFANRTRPYAAQQADGSYRWVYEEATPQLIAAHLAGETTLAFSSTDARGRCRWACLDVDVPGSLPQLLTLRAALAELGLPGLVEASRRGGHLWLLLDEPAPVVALRHAMAEALEQAAAMGVEIPAHELYPDAQGRGMLGHAVRLQLGVHRRTGRRYALFDEQGLPCAFTTMEKAAQFVLGSPRVAASRLRERWQAMIAERRAAKAERSGAMHGERVALATVTEQADARSPEGCSAVESQSRTWGPPRTQGTQGTQGTRVGTRSAVIRWVDACVSPLELLRELTPELDFVHFRGIWEKNEA